MNITYLNPIEYQQVPHTTFIYSKYWPQTPSPQQVNGHIQLMVKILDMKMHTCKKNRAS